MKYYIEELSNLFIDRVEKKINQARQMDYHFSDVYLCVKGIKDHGRTGVYTTTLVKKGKDFETLLKLGSYIQSTIPY